MTEQPERARDRGDLGAAGATTRPVEPDGAAVRATPAGLLHAVGWALAYAATAWLGQRTAIADTGFALFWPAAGVGLAWIATGTRRMRPYELALLGVLAGTAAYSLEHTVWSALAGAVGTVLAIVVFLVASRAWAPGLWGTGGTAEIGSLRQYAVLLAATVVAGAAEAVAVFALLLPGADAGERTGELAITHTIGRAAVGLTLLVISGYLRALPGRGVVDRLASLRHRIRRVDAVLGLGGFIVTVAIFLAGFAWFEDAPVSFVLVMAVVAVGVRYSAATTGSYALAVTAAACWLTAAGRGPVAGIPEEHRQALAFGLFTAALVGTGLVIALSRRERDAIIGRLRESERAAEVLADDLTLVLANLEEGVAVVEEGGRFIHANPAIGRLLAMPDFNTERVEDVDRYRLAHADGSPLLESEVPHVRVFAGEDEVRDVLHLARPDVPVSASTRCSPVSSRRSARRTHRAR